MAAAAREPTFVLLHSPLVGPASWSAAARELERRGCTAVVPSLLGVAEGREPGWRHIVHATREATRNVRQRVVLVGHSAAGVLLPTIADALTVEVAALVFVDSLLPPPAGGVPLGPPRFIEQLRALASDGVLPPWSAWFGPDAMRELVPDERVRAELEAEMPRLPLSYFEATVPVPDGWPDRRPCAYVLLSAAEYGESAAEARAYGWPVIEIPGVQHLAIATSPTEVTDALLELERSLKLAIGPARRT